MQKRYRKEIILLVVFLTAVSLGFFAFTPSVFAQETLSDLDATKGGTLLSIAESIIDFIRKLSSPIVIILIIWAGVLFMTSQGDPAKVKKARDTLLYTIVGFGILLIGKGFISLLQSILDLRGPGS